MTRIDVDWLKSEATQSVFQMLEVAGYQAFAVGGCVRDGLLGLDVNDVDVATDARPERVIDLADQAGFHAIPTGIDHGTVTVVSSGKPHEITTFRRDVETDGRHATVAYSDNIRDDARRRDFTMNALYASRVGEIKDPVGGLEDLYARRIRFIEDASTRIREDYLRSLRFFRFHAWYGDAAEGFDPDAMAAIAENTEGISRLSRERIGSEVLKTLSAPDPAPAVSGMQATGVLPLILPGADARAMAPLIALELTTSTPPDQIRRLAALGGEDPMDRLRLSKKQAEKLGSIRRAMEHPSGEAGYRFGAEVARDGILVLAALRGMPVKDSDLREALDASSKVFPLEASDLIPLLQGPALGTALRSLEQAWIDSDFQLDRSDLLALLKKLN